MPSGRMCRAISAGLAIILVFFNAVLLAHPVLLLAHAGPKRAADGQSEVTMTVNAILTAGHSPTQSASQTANSGGKNYADWMASLQSALGGGASSTSGGGGLTDQMQALLTQLQAGNTTAPSGASESSNVAATTATQGSSGQTHHHHHHGDSASANNGVTGSSSSSSGSGDTSGGVLQDVASGLVGNMASAAGSGSDALLGGGASNNLLTGLDATGGVALTGVKQAIQAYASMHGVQFAQPSATN